MTPQDLDHQRLAAALKARIDELGLKWIGLARYARTSTQTIRNLRDGKHLPGPDTRNRIEDYVLWQRGDVMVLLRGGDATPISPDSVGRALLTLPTAQTPPPHGLGSDLDRLGLSSDDPDVRAILGLEHISHRQKIRWLAELADVIAAESHHDNPPKDESPQQGRN